MGILFLLVASVALLVGLFGPGIAALYVASGLAIATTAGFVIGRLHLEAWVEPFVFAPAPATQNARTSLAAARSFSRSGKRACSRMRE